MQYSYGLWWFLTHCNRKVLVSLALINLLVTLISLGPAISKEWKAFDDIILTVEYIIPGRHLDISWSRKLKKWHIYLWKGNLLHIRPIFLYSGFIRQFDLRKTFICLTYFLLFPFFVQGINVLLKCTGWSRQWQPTLVLLPGKSHGRRSLVGCSPWGR